MKKRLIALVITVFMLISLVSVFAEEAYGPTELDKIALVMEVNSSESSEMLYDLITANSWLEVYCSQYEQYINYSIELKDYTYDILISENPDPYEVFEEFVTAFDSSVTEAYTRYEEEKAKEQLVADKRNEFMVKLAGLTAVSKLKPLMEEYNDYLMLDLDALDKFSDDVEYIFLCNLFSESYETLECFEDKFKEQLLLAEINSSSNPGAMRSAVEANCNTLGLVMTEYNSFTEGNKAAVFYYLIKKLPFQTISDVAKCFYYAVAEEAVPPADSPSYPIGGSGGGSGGGGGIGYAVYEAYITDADGKLFEVLPDDGTDIIVSILIRWEGENCVYVLKETDDTGVLTDVRTFNSTATVKDEMQLFTFNTKYYSNREYEWLTLKNLSTLEPLNYSTRVSLFIDEIPEKEEEIEGITAVKGRIEQYNGDSISMYIHSKRVLGYWGGEWNAESNPQIIAADITPELPIYNEHSDCVTYNLKATDSGYVLDSVELGEGEIITFNFMEGNVTDSGIQLRENDTFTTYNYSSNLWVYYNYALSSVGNINTCDYYVARIVNNEVCDIHGLKYNAQKVVAVDESDIAMYDATTWSAEYVIGEMPAAEDVVILEEMCGITYLRKAEKIEGAHILGEIITETENYRVNANSGIPICEGETLYGYIERNSKVVKYLEKNYSSKNLLVVTGENGDSLITQNGDFAMVNTDDKMYLPFGNTEEYFNRAFPYIMYYFEYKNELRTEVCFEGLPLLYHGIGKYMKAANVLGGYILSSDTKIYGIGSEKVVENPELTDNYQYSLKIYTTDGINADVILIENYSDEASSEKIYAVVSEVNEGSVTCLAGGEEITVSTSALELYLDIYAGDLVAIEYSEDEIVGMSIEFSMQTNGKIEYYNNRYAYLPVVATSETALIGEYAGTAGIIRYPYAINSSTEIYKMNSSGEIETATISDIYVNPINLMQSSWAVIYAVNSTAKIVIVI